MNTKEFAALSAAGQAAKIVKGYSTQNLGWVMGKTALTPSTPLLEGMVVWGQTEKFWLVKDIKVSFETGRTMGYMIPKSGAIMSFYKEAGQSWAGGDRTRFDYEEVVRFCWDVANPETPPHEVPVENPGEYSQVFGQGRTGVWET